MESKYYITVQAGNGEIYYVGHDGAFYSDKSHKDVAVYTSQERALDAASYFTRKNPYYKFEAKSEDRLKFGL